MGKKTLNIFSYKYFASIHKPGFCSCMLPHSLSISIMPLSSHRVLFEQGRDPVLTLCLPFTSRFSLSFLQDELLIGRLGLVLVVDGPGHMLPESDGETVNDIINKMYQMMNRYKKGEADLSDSNSPCSSGGTVQRVSRLCRSSGVGFQKVSTVPVFLSLMKISLSYERNNNRAHNITKFIHLTLFILHS